MQYKRKHNSSKLAVCSKIDVNYTVDIFAVCVKGTPQYRKDM